MQKNLKNNQKINKINKIKKVKNIKILSRYSINKSKILNKVKIKCKKKLMIQINRLKDLIYQKKIQKINKNKTNHQKNQFY